MGKFISGILITLVVLFLLGYYFYTKSGNSLDLNNLFATKGTIVVGSQEFLNGKYIPMKYTCDWQDVNPPLTIDRVPGDARSLVLVVEDADTTQPFTHWIVYNLPPETQNIEEDKVPDGYIGKNDFGKEEYDGPCPPENETHKYYFKVFALNTTLSLPGGITRLDLDNAMKGHVIGHGELYGSYLRVAN